MLWKKKRGAGALVGALVGAGAGFAYTKLGYQGG